MSTPGKVLIIGGYLVLEKPLQGLVIAASARFQVDAGFVPRPPHAVEDVVVRSPQFHSTCKYTLPVPTSPTAPFVPKLHPAEYVACAGRLGGPRSGRALAWQGPLRLNSDLRLQPSPLPFSPHSDHSPMLGFVVMAIHTALWAAEAILGPEALAQELLATGVNGERLQLVLTLRGGNDFYSQVAHLEDRELPVTPANLAALPPFLPLPLSP